MNRLARYLLAVVIVVVVTLVANLCGGCTSAPDRTIEAASTEIGLPLPDGKALTVRLPKEVDATGLELTVDLQAQTAVLKADRLKTSSRALVEATTEAQADAIGEAGETVREIVPAIVPALLP